MSNEQIREAYVPPPLPEVEYRLPRRFTHHELKADRSRLRLLARVYMFMAFLLSVAGLVSWMYVLIEIAIVCGVLGLPLTDGPRRHALIAIGCGVPIGTVLWTLAGCVIVAARSLLRLKRYKYCIVTAILFCALPPLGTVLGLCTILVLLRDSVKEWFIHGELAFQPDPEED